MSKLLKIILSVLYLSAGFINNASSKECTCNCEKDDSKWKCGKAIPSQ